MFSIKNIRLNKAGIIIIASLAIITIIYLGFHETQSTLSSVIKLYSILFLLVGISIYLLKHLQNNNVVNLNESRLVINDKISLEPGVSVYIIEGQSEKWLIGVGNKTITFLDKFENKLDQSEFSEILEQEKSKI